MKILNKTESKLLNRIEVLIEYPHSSKPTPRKDSLKEEIAKEFSSKPELVAIRKVQSRYGSSTSKIFANIYKSEDELTKTEPRKKVKKGEDAPKEQPKAEEKPAETPKEEPKEVENAKETETKE